MTLTIVDEQAISFPWIELVKNAYSMRIRVTNFSAVGKRSFTRILSKAVGGANSYFLMQDGDPLSTDYLPSEDLQLEKVTAVGLDGRCYDENANEINENLRCLTLSHAPVTDQAVLLAQRAMVIEALISKNIEHLMLPEPVVVGTSPDVVIKTNPSKSASDWTKFDANDDHDTIVRPEVKRLSQWDNGQLKTLLQNTVLSFQMETGLPPQDAQVLDTLGATTQSLVSNRESFVSRIYVIKQDLNAVFESLGIALDYELTFPQTAQDIASIGDAYGKGANADILKKYQVI
jgi:hypothetical protein